MPQISHRLATFSLQSENNKSSLRFGRLSNRAILRNPPSGGRLPLAPNVSQMVNLAGRNAIRRNIVPETRSGNRIVAQEQPEFRMDPVTLAFDTFWTWLNAHPNCILRAGTPDAVLYDHDDLHWHFSAEEEGKVKLVQLLRGKLLSGEIFVEADQITYVQGVPGEAQEEYTFELISETERNQTVAYFFVLAHGYEDERAQGRVH